MRKFYVYILITRNNCALYIGVTSNLSQRIAQYKERSLSVFTKRYQATKLVYYEESKYIINAIQKEKKLKKWKRECKNRLIGEMNPDWEDLNYIFI